MVLLDMTQRSQCWHLQRVTHNKAFEGLTRSHTYKPWLELFWQQHPPWQLAAALAAETFHLHESLCSSHQALLEHCKCQFACLFCLKGCMGYFPLTHCMTHCSCSIVQLYFITNSVVRSPQLCVCLIGLIINIVCIVLR
jgi:hypothetical protein